MKTLLQVLFGSVVQYTLNKNQFNRVLPPLYFICTVIGLVILAFSISSTISSITLKQSNPMNHKELAKTKAMMRTNKRTDQMAQQFFTLNDTSKKKYFNALERIKTGTIVITILSIACFCLLKIITRFKRDIPDPTKPKHETHHVSILSLQAISIVGFIVVIIGFLI